MQPISFQKAVPSQSLNLRETKIFIEYYRKRSLTPPRTINYSPNGLTKLEQHQYSVSVFWVFFNQISASGSILQKKKEQP